MHQQRPLDHNVTPDHMTPVLPAGSEHRRGVCRAVTFGKLIAMSILVTVASDTNAGRPVPAIVDDACALADIPREDALVDIPFDTVDGRIYVQARVNGRGPFRFAVDTGASGMGRADTSLVTSLGLSMDGETITSDGVTSASVETTHIDSLELGGLTQRDMDVTARDYNSRNAPDAMFSGIIAREFFSDGLLVIDYPRKRLVFTRARRLPAAGNNVLGYERAFRIPVSIGALQTVGQLDTGAAIGFVLPQALYEQVAADPLEQAGRAQLTNGKIDTQRATVHGPFRVGKISASDLEVRVSKEFPELLVGAHALQEAVILIDQRSRSVAVCD